MILQDSRIHGHMDIPFYRGVSIGSDMKNIVQNDIWSGRKEEKNDGRIEVM